MRHREAAEDVDGREDDRSEARNRDERMRVADLRDRATRMIPEIAFVTDMSGV